MNSNISGPDRLHSLDALRGAAALAVVFWHWQHFGAIGSTPQSFERHLQPQYGVFRIFYDHGWLAVDLFFSLSGFIFFWLYSKSISAHQLTPAKFFVLRFSRLYPLHIATLLFVAVGQLIYIAINGSGYVYGNTNASHFALNVILSSSIGFEKGYSFNGPIWSVSVECFLYVCFFMLCRARLIKPAILIIISAIGFSLLYRLYPPIGRGIGSFFLGGVTYAAYSHFTNRPDAKGLSLCAVGLTLVLWVATITYVYLGLAFKDLPVLWRLSGIFPGRGFAEIALFPITILTLALYESKFKVNVPGLEFLGSISYSSYLLHFPLQLSFALILPAIGMTSAFFQTNTSLILFFVLLLIVSAASFKYLEMPAQQHLRRRWLTPRSS
jgi:peptidoglycan/LPS O-acetylase OafA/YrhL